MARQTNGTKHPTRGGQLLAKVADSEREIAERLDVSASLVDRWINGQRQPTDADMARLSEAYGIPPTAWNEPQLAKPPAPKRGSSNDPRPTDEDDERGTGDGQIRNEARLNRLIRDGMRELENDTDLSATKKAEALKKLADAQVALARSTGTNAITQARIVAHPEFKRVVQKITDAIAVCPACLRTATEVLEKAAAGAHQ